MRPHFQKFLWINLSIILLSLFSSCTKDILDETEELHSTQLNASTSKTLILTPIHDTYMQENKSYNNSLIRVRNGLRKSYLMFDLSEIDGEIISASLELTVRKDPGNGTVTAFIGSRADWTESNLTPKNQPTRPHYLGRINNTYQIGDTEKMDLKTDYFTKGKNTIVLSQNDGEDVSFASRETSLGPKLIITYDNSSANKTETVVPDGYYVTVNGKSSNKGLSESSSWSLEHAIATAKAGDIVYIKAGNYGYKQLNVKNSGTSSKPIKFIGYRNTPGDIRAVNGSTFSYGDPIDSGQMPLLKASRSGSRGQGVAIINWRSYVEFSNLQIQYYTEGIRNSGNYTKFDNIIVKDVGDLGSSRYEGKGIVLYGNNVELTNSIVINAGAEAISIKKGTHQYHSYNAIYSNNSTNPTDYYYLLSSNSINNSLENIHIERKNGLSHRGHGLILKESAANNIASNVKVINTNIELSYSGVEYNTIQNSEIVGAYNVTNDIINDITACSYIQVSNGAHHNTFKNIKLTKTNRAVVFNDWDDGLNSPLDAKDAGNNNTFNNIQINGSAMGIHFSEFQKNSSSAHGNKFVNCSFKNIKRMFVVNRPNSGNSFQGCAFEGIKELEYTSKGYGYKMNSNTVWSNCSFKNNNFKAPN